MSDEESVARPIKTAPRVARELKGSGALPALENLKSKSAEELIKTLGRFGIKPDLKAIDQRAIRSFQKLNEMLADGVMPDEHSWAALAKQHENEMAGSLRQMTKRTIQLYQQSKSEPDDKEAWITRGDDDVCLSCEPLHGQIKTHAEWEKAGLPGTSAHVCGRECRCRLVPVGGTKENQPA